MAENMHNRSVRSRGAAPTWIVGVAGVMIGMLAMWILVKVDFGSLPSSNADNPKTLARAAFDALKTDDFEAWRPYIPNADDFSAFYDKVVADASSKRRKSIDRQLVRDGGFRGMALKQLEENRRSFKEARAAANSSGLDWSRATFDGVDDSKTEFREKHGIRNGHIGFGVRVDKRRFVFVLRGCAAPRHSWACANGIEMLNAEPRRVVAVDPQVAPIPKLPSPSAGLPARPRSGGQLGDAPESDAAAAQLRQLQKANEAKRAWEQEMEEQARGRAGDPKGDPAKSGK